MNEVLGAIARWLEEQRRTDRVSATVLAVLALGSGLAVFLLTTLLVYTILTGQRQLDFSSDSYWFARGLGMIGQRFWPRPDGLEPGCCK